MCRIYDISPLLHSGIAVWPGDQPLVLEKSLAIAEGDHLDLSSVRMSLHTGSHMDAPSHYLPGGPSIDRVDLARCVGRARVFSWTGGRAVGPEGIRIALQHCPCRLLMRADPARSPDEFSRDFSYLSEEAARILVGQGVLLFGTDSPSVDAFDSEDLPAHRVLGEAGVLIVENLVLSGVPDGDYELIALPLRLAGAEASPVRAVLIDPDSRAHAESPNNP